MILGNNISFYDVKITGKDVKRFLHNLHKMHIEFLNITFFKNSVIIKVSKEDYKKILKKLLKIKNVISFFNINVAITSNIKH